jgi:pSer/pThr/pTyr-binding forkhead associated (FHA) protein
MEKEIEAACPVLVRVGGSAASVRLNRALTIVGSKQHSHLRIVSPAISGSHALLLNLGNHVFLRDLMSRTHVVVNGGQVRDCPLKDGDVVEFGEMRFRFVDSDVLRQSLSSVRPAPGRLESRAGAAAVVLSEPLWIIGRQAGADLVVAEANVSKAHAVIYEHEGHRVLRDLGSRHGTQVNGEPIRSSRLNEGDVIEIGGWTWTYHAADPPAGGANEGGKAESWEVGEMEGAGESHVFVSEPVIVSDVLDLRNAELGEGFDLDEERDESRERGGGELAMGDSAARGFEAVESEWLAPAEIVADPLPDQSGGSAADLGLIWAEDSKPVEEAAPGASSGREEINRQSPILGEVPELLVEPREGKKAEAQPAKPLPPGFDEVIAADVLPLFPGKGNGGGSVSVSNASKPGQSYRKRLLLLGGSLSALGLLGAAAWFYLRHR